LPTRTLSDHLLGYFNDLEWRQQLDKLPSGRLTHLASRPIDELDQVLQSHLGSQTLRIVSSDSRVTRALGVHRLLNSPKDGRTRVATSEPLRVCAELISSECGLPLQRMIAQLLNDQEWNQLVRSMSRISELCERVDVTENQGFIGFTEEQLASDDEIMVFDEDMHFRDEVEKKGQEVVLTESSSMLIKPAGCTEPLPSSIPLELRVVSQAKNRMKIAVHRGRDGPLFTYALDTSTLAMAAVPPIYLVSNSDPVERKSDGD